MEQDIAFLFYNIDMVGFVQSNLPPMFERKKWNERT